MHAARLLVLAGLAAAVIACSDSSEEPPVTGAVTTDPTASTPTFVGDGSAFCDAMLGVGTIEPAADATPADVLAENERLLELLGEAQVNTPEDAPPDFDALLDDYRAAAEAIADANGNVEAAFVTLSEEAPEVVARLGSSTSHAAAYDFLVARCGISGP